MRHWKILVIVAAVGLLVLGTVGLAFARGPAQNGTAAAVQMPQGRGVEGVITSIQDNVVTLQTGRGELKVTVNDATVYRMPPEGIVTLVDVQQALQEAVAQDAKVRAIVMVVKDGDILTAKSMLIVPPPSKVTHFVGKVTAIEGNTITATNAAGETMTATVPDASNVKIGQQIVLGIGPGPVMQKGMQGMRQGLRQGINDFFQRFRNQLRAPSQGVPSDPPPTQPPAPRGTSA